MRSNCRRLFAAISVIMAINAGSMAHAVVISSIPGGTDIQMPNLNYFGTGPQDFGTPAVTWSSQYSSSVFGYDGGYCFADNGCWGAGLVVAGTNSLTATMTFQFASPLDEVGGFLNYARGDPSYGTATISVYDTSDNLIESDVLSFSTGGGYKPGQFVGFSETTPIGYFSLTGAAIGITDLTVSVVPEPSTWALMLFGLAGLVFAGYRQRMTAPPQAFQSRCKPTRHFDRPLCKSLCDGQSSPGLTPTTRPSAVRRSASSITRRSKSSALSHGSRLHSCFPSHVR